MEYINAYLMFDGECREAMEFYQNSLGGQLDTMPYEGRSAGGEDRLMHASLRNGGAILMASDRMPGKGPKRGDNVQLAIQCGSEQELERLFGAMGEGGEVTMPLQDTFWGAKFGMLTDRFGIFWMFNSDKPRG